MDEDWGGSEYGRDGRPEILSASASGEVLWDAIHYPKRGRPDSHEARVLIVASSKVWLTYPSAIALVV
jgi:hypothetical protein